MSVLLTSENAQNLVVDFRANFQQLWPHNLASSSHKTSEVTDMYDFQNTNVVNTITMQKLPLSFFQRIVCLLVPIPCRSVLLIGRQFSEMLRHTCDDTIIILTCSSEKSIEVITADLLPFPYQLIYYSWWWCHDVERCIATAVCSVDLVSPSLLLCSVACFHSSVVIWQLCVCRLSLQWYLCWWRAAVPVL